MVDANEGWAEADLERYLAAMRDAGVVMVEQPLPAGRDDALLAARAAGLAGRDAGLPLGADESVHVRADLGAVEGLYDVVNVKLDKAGELTEALELADEARARGFDLMAGCMMATSLSLAPATLAAHRARFVDLDGSL